MEPIYGLWFGALWQHTGTGGLYRIDAALVQGKVNGMWLDGVLYASDSGKFWRELTDFTDNFEYLKD